MATYKYEANKKGVKFQLKQKKKRSTKVHHTRNESFEICGALGCSN